MVSGADKLPVGAHYGLRDWLSQRVTAIVMTLYTALLLGIVLWHGGLDYATWKSLMAENAFRIATFLFMVSLFVHAWVGVRNILMDYAKPTSVRLTLQIVVICVLVAYAGWTIQVLWDTSGDGPASRAASVGAPSADGPSRGANSAPSGGSVAAGLANAAASVGALPA